MSTTVAPENHRFAALSSHRMAAPIAIGCCLAGGAAYVTAMDPSESSGFLPCPFRTLTGLWCPGCGLTRATHHLLRGDVIQAFRYHLFVVPVLAAIAATWAVWSIRRWRVTNPDAARITPPTWLIGAASVVLVAFSVARNLPGFDSFRG